MAFYNKIGLLILTEDKTKFLTVRKFKQNVTDDYIMPGGLFEENSVQETIVAEIKEELNSGVDLDSIEFIGEYEDIAAGRPNQTVNIRLYSCALLDEPESSTEIESIHWIDSTYKHNSQVSPIIRNKIIPDLIKRGLLLNIKDQ